MSQIIVSPQAQRHFARDIEVLVGELRDRHRRLEEGMRELSGTWKDERYRTFQKAVETASLQLQMFYNMGDRYAEFLRRKADAGDRYLGNG